MKKPLLFRHQQITRIRQKIEQGGYPRFVMLLLLMQLRLPDSYLRIFCCMPE